MLLRWDLLGVSRFFLVLFYNNWDSCSGAMNTVLTNRLGDFFLFIFMRFFFFSYLRFFFLVRFYFVVVFFLVMAGFTKRAQLPFRGWLPKAMRAPTPVRALVHSRTLVTAGLILIINFKFLVFRRRIIIVLVLVGLLTILFSRLCALVEPDIKKVVALRTLSQIGFSIITVGIGLYFVSLIHLVRHALFKSCLFIQVGIFIHSYFRQQDARNYSSVGIINYFVQLQMFVTLFCLCGLFFTRGSVTKDRVLEFFFFNSWYFVLGVIFFVGVFFTFLYRYILFLSLLRNYNFSLVIFHGSLISSFCRLLLVVFSIFGLWWLTNNILFLPVVYIYIDFFVPLF